MNLVGLSFAYLRDRALNTALNVLLLALAVATMVILVLFSAQLGERFERDAKGFDLVVGAKGSPLQLILSSIYQVDVPTGNIPQSTINVLRRDPTVAKVIPMALGDNFRGFRIVGTEPSYPQHYGGEIASGRYWAAPSEAVIGAEVARQTGAQLGQRFEGSHGMASDGGQDHDARPFQVVGVLRPTGTVVDRLILTSVESVWDVHGIAHDEATSEPGHEQETEAEHAAAGAQTPEPEVTALLVTYRSALAAVRLPNLINKQTQLQAAAPAVETTRLLALLGVGIEAVKGFAALLMLTGGLSIFVALYTALRQREGDMAMLRVMGAAPSAIFGQVLLEGLLLAAGGALLGLALGHGVVAIAAASFEQLHEIGLTAWRFEPAELVIVAIALILGAVSALIPALRVFRVDVASTLSHAR